MKLKAQGCHVAVDMRQASRHQNHTGRWFLMSLLYLGAVGKTARWLSKEARRRQLLRRFVEQPGAAFMPPQNDALTQTEPPAPPAQSRKKSSITQAFDQAIEQAQVPFDGREGEKAQRIQATPRKRSNRPGSSSSGSARVYSNEPLLTAEESKYGPEDDLRAREFPVPPAALKSVSKKVAIDQNPLPEEGLREGGKLGSVDGDRDSPDITTSVVDQVEIQPDLAQEQG